MAVTVEVGDTAVVSAVAGEGDLAEVGVSASRGPISTPGPEPMATRVLIHLTGGKRRFPIAGK